MQSRKLEVCARHNGQNGGWPDRWSIVGCRSLRVASGGLSQTSVEDRAEVRRCMAVNIPSQYIERARGLVWVGSRDITGGRVFN